MKAFVSFHMYMSLRELKANFPFVKERTEALQLAKLRRLAVHACANHEFYRKRFDKSGVNPRNIQSVEDLKKLPLLTKEEYRAFTDAALAADGPKFAGYYRDSTSGSTGVPLTIVRSWPERGYMVAKWLREISLNGYRFSDRTFRMISPHRMTQGKDSFLQMFGLFRRDVISYLAPEAEKLAAYQRANPTFFYGNKTQVVELARYIEENGLPIVRPRMYAVGAETIDDNSRALFYRVFGEDNFFETYGCEETGILGFQIKGTPGLHFSHDTNILELLNEDGLDARESGSCVITDLGIFSFPLIRYHLGDHLDTYVDDATGLRKIGRIRGRLNDWLVWKDGSRTDYHHFYEVMGAFSKEIAQFRIIQEAYDFIRILVVLSATQERAAMEERLRNHIVRCMKSQMRDDVHYEVTIVQNIPADANGKIRMILSNVHRDA